MGSSGVQQGSMKPFWLAMGIGLIAVFYTQGGYQNTINFGADMKNARKNMPRAILRGMLIIITCYLLINAAYYKILGIPGIAGAKLVAAEVAKVTFGHGVSERHLFAASQSLLCHG